MGLQMQEYCFSSSSDFHLGLGTAALLAADESGGRAATTIMKLLCCSSFPIPPATRLTKSQQPLLLVAWDWPKLESFAC